jgi:hypothetical protein
MREFYAGVWAGSTLVHQSNIGRGMCGQADHISDVVGVAMCIRDAQSH